ncbi:hypothetical protein [Streptomyces sp. NBC_00690]|uniref:hypothetical protein n=1 Tax=Streptomyces sp. NBC_00690 TaxID=2975808 RepID=UPI002E2D3B15|nr:hypothetical protein [Streptomyces sp. NBC_00690]
MSTEPFMDLYSRNGFAGPATMLVRHHYAPDYTAVKGDYVPRRIDTAELDPALFADPRSLPQPVLVADDVRLEAWHRQEPTPFALRNVFMDELHFVLSGSARLETNFGVLDLSQGDFVLIPRAVIYRLTRVEDLQLLIVASDSRLEVKPDNPGVLNIGMHLDIPAIDQAPAPEPGEYEVLVRHGDETTSYFYAHDPVPVVAVAGPPMVQRFNLNHVQGISVPVGSLPPGRLIDDETTRTLVYYLGARPATRSPVHHNADYDEIIVYAAGPGTYGAVNVPGTVMFTPKGVIHQGPDENVPDGYVAWLLETRSPMRPTPAALAVSRLMETSQFDVHPSETTESAK